MIKKKIFIKLFYWKVFYIMKDIYKYSNKIECMKIRLVQQSLYMGKPKYILKI